MLAPWHCPQASCRPHGGATPDICAARRHGPLLDRLYQRFNAALDRLSHAVGLPLRPAREQNSRSCPHKRLSPQARSWPRRGRDGALPASRSKRITRGCDGDGADVVRSTGAGGNGGPFALPDRSLRPPSGCRDQCCDPVDNDLKRMGIFADSRSRMRFSP